MTKILASIDDMKKHFVVWTTRVMDMVSKVIECLHESGETSRSFTEVEEDQLSIYPTEIDDLNNRKFQRYCH